MELLEEMSEVLDEAKSWIKVKTDPHFTDSIQSDSGDQVIEFIDEVSAKYKILKGNN